VILTYPYRLLPLKSQHRAWERLLHAQRDHYYTVIELSHE